MPRPNGLWTFRTKKGNFFRDRPSSPWSSSGNVFRKLIWPFLSRSKTGWSGCWSRKFFHQPSQMSPSLCSWGRSKPLRMWRQLFCRRNTIQSLIRRKGIFRASSLVSKKVFRTGNVNRYFLPSNLWQSLSLLLVFLLESWSKPSDFEAAADSPKSETTFRAVRITPAQEASARESSAFWDAWTWDSGWCI